MGQAKCNDIGGVQMPIERAKHLGATENGGLHDWIDFGIARDNRGKVCRKRHDDR